MDYPFDIDGAVVKAVVVHDFTQTRKQIDKLCADAETLLGGYKPIGSAWTETASW